MAEFVERVRNTSEVERLSAEGQLEKRGVFTGAYAINPFNGAEVPIYLADYVLGTYGTGAIMAVPGEDQRDLDFAVVYELPIIKTTERPRGLDRAVYTGPGQQDQQRQPRRIQSRRDGRRRGQGGRHRLAGRAGAGRRQGQLPAAGLADLPAALLGLPHPHRLLPRARRPGRSPRTDLPVLLPEDVEFLPSGESPLRAPRGLPQRHLPEVRRAGDPRDRHDGHLRRLVVVLPALLRRHQCARRRSTRPRSAG